MSIETAKPFQLVAGNAALDFVNTLDDRFRESGPEDLLVSYSDLQRFLTQSGLLSAEQSRVLKSLARHEENAIRVLYRVKNLRETVAAVAYALLDGKEVFAPDLAELNKYFRQANAAKTLQATGDRLIWTWPTIPDLATPLWLLAHEAADLLLSDRAALLRRCASDTCRWLFLDTSKNHSRRWCDMKICGNRMKARRFHARTPVD